MTVVLVLASALLHAAWNAIIKADRDPSSAGVMVLALSGLLAATLAFATPGRAFPNEEGMQWALLAGIFEAGYFLSLVWCLQRASLGQVYPFSRGGALLFIWPLSIVLLSEEVITVHAAGAAMVGAGLWLTGQQRGTKVGDQEDLRGPGMLPLALCALCIACFHLLYKQALGTGAQPPAVFALSMAVAVPVSLFWHRRGLAQRWKDLRWGPLCIAALICTLSFVFALLGLKEAGAGWVLTLRNTSVVFALAFSWRLGERVGRQRLAGALLIALGAVLLGWSKGV